MKTTIKEITEQLFNKDSLKDIGINDILDLSRRSLYEFVFNLLKTCVECDMQTLGLYDAFFNDLNILVDDFIMENENIVNDYYNIISLNLLSFYTHAFYNEKHRDEIYDQLMKDNIIYPIIDKLNKFGSLTHAELAKELNIAATTLSNRLNGIKDSNVVRKYKLPTNQKQTYYSLTADCKRYYNKTYSDSKEKSNKQYILAMEDNTSSKSKFGDINESYFNVARNQKIDFSKLAKWVTKNSYPFSIKKDKNKHFRCRESKYGY